MESLSGRPFHKMTGSGNDFVVFSADAGPAADIERADVIRAICARGTGVGADGVVFLESAGSDRVRMRYYNADGSRASLCGNASLCTVRLAQELGLVSEREFTLETDSGNLAARLVDDWPEIDLEPIEEVRPDASELRREPGEQRLGFALVGVPHVVVASPDLNEAPVLRRGAELRYDKALETGANVNFVSPTANGGWAFRTYERGVEGETLACGSGAVATAILLAAWGLAGDQIVLETRSGMPLTVRLKRGEGQWLASLKGEGRIVFQGRIAQLG